MDTISDRRKRYDLGGHSYEEQRYALPHWKTYFDIRSNAIAEVIGTKLDGDRQTQVLEIGCGSGVTLDYIARRHGTRCSLFGLDYSPVMLHQAASKVEVSRGGARILQANAQKLPFGNDHFDVVYATRFIHQFDHKTKLEMADEMRRVLRKDGVLVLEFYSRTYHWLRFHTFFRKGRTKEGFFPHYPTADEVLEIMGEGIRRVPVRIAAAHLFHRTLGDRLYRKLTQISHHTPGRVLVDEYLVVGGP